jgi:hypothetical protein
VRFVSSASPEIRPLPGALEAHRIRLIPFRHESAGAHMAEGLYKTTGEVAVVIGNPGPGSANLLGGVITARHEGVPLVAITSQHRLGIVYPSPPSTFQGQDQLDVYRPVVKWGGPIFSWDRIPEIVRLAFREMWTGRPGPVQIELPAPVLYATGEESSVAGLRPGPTARRCPRRPRARIHEVAALLGVPSDARHRAAPASIALGPTRRCSRVVERSDVPSSPRWRVARWCRSTIPIPSTVSEPAATSPSARLTSSWSRARGSGTWTCRTTSTGATRRPSASMQLDIDPGTSASRARSRSASSPI